MIIRRQGRRIRGREHSEKRIYEVSLNPSPPLGHVINCISLSVRYAVCHQWIYPIYQSVITRGVMYLRREVHR